MSTIITREIARRLPVLASLVILVTLSIGSI
jgi:hypothetical protein